VPEALVAVNVDVGKEDYVFEELLKMPEVREVFMVYGIYDIMVVVVVPDIDMLRKTVTGRIRKIEGVKSTLTMVVVRKESKGSAGEAGSQS